MTPAPHPRALLARWGLRPRKKYGQNFLIDSNVAARIARLCISDGIEAVVEIGAGTGALTDALVECGARVTALEIDPDLAALLRSRETLPEAEIVCADALEFDYAAWAAGRRWAAVGNLPYNVATPFLLRFCEMRDGPESIVAMIQKDVADRLAAAPGSAAYGSLSVAVQYAMTVERAFTLGPRAFYPAPKVDSSVVRLVRREAPLVTPRDPELFWKVVRGAFAYRRKTFVNSLALALRIPHETIAQAAHDLGLSAELRGERLDIYDFARMADELAAR